MFILIDLHVRHFSGRKSNSVSNVKKINPGLPLCQNNVNGVYEASKNTVCLKKCRIKGGGEKQKQDHIYGTVARSNVCNRSRL
jgi:hypothetical protein